MEQPYITIDCNQDKLDLTFIHDFMTLSFWAEGITREEMQTCINNSLNFGVYLSGKQIGYARVVTDYVQLAYLMDVFIDTLSKAGILQGVNGLYHGSSAPEKYKEVAAPHQ